MPAEYVFQDSFTPFEGPGSSGKGDLHAPRRASPAAGQADRHVDPALIDFVDAAGVRWWVSERDCRRELGARADSCLVFNSAQTVRRVWQYPSLWRELSAEALSALSMRV
jgi:hypothetical protein